jgi:opacity protein-like surface antigen
MAQIESIKTNRNPNVGIPEINQMTTNASITPILIAENTSTTIAEQKPKIKTPISFSITPNLSLNTLNTRIVTGEDLGSRREYLRKQITESETAKLGVSFGVGLEVNLTKRITLESGLSYSEKNTTIKPRTISAERDREGKIKYRFDCSAGTYYIDPKLGTTLSVGDSTKSFSANNKLQYINTPLIARYQLATGKFNWFQMVGVGANVLVGQSFETSIDNNITEKLKNLKTSDLKKMYFNAIVGAGIDYNISKKIAIRIVPAYRFSITPMNKNESIKTYPNSFSAMAGLKIGL